MVQVTAQQIQDWKEKYGDCIYKIPLATGESYYVRTPKIKELEAAQPLLQNGRPISYNISLFTVCYLGGDEIPKHDEMKLSAVAGKMMETIETIEAGLEKV